MLQHVLIELSVTVQLADGHRAAFSGRLSSLSVRTASQRTASHQLLSSRLLRLTRALTFLLRQSLVAACCYTQLLQPSRQVRLIYTAQQQVINLLSALSSQLSKNKKAEESKNLTFPKLENSKIAKFLTNNFS